ncbi:hypothetical protein GGI07_000416 [Coemansia sp. Benny D115]|nr:hypothetical protein GGI07_000416 [Coemansia sp. Benny D115]
MLKCTRNGCGQEYDAATNDSMSCQYHPGKPEFHEGLKGWTCCKPRVHSFDEFMEIRGCQLGPHSNEPVHKEDPFKADLTKYDDVVAPPPAPVEAKPVEELKTKPKKQEEEVPLDEDPQGIEIAPGTPCKRHGCKAQYVDEVQSHGSDQCVFHPGTVVFHEGKKGWTCCKPRATEFEEFLAIPGCTRGRHLFVGSAPAAELKTKKCRRDYYQSSDKVIVSFYAKKIDKERSSIKFEDDKILVHLVYGEDVSDEQIPLFARIDPSASSFEFLSTKAEVTLIKRAPAQWPALEREE